MATPGRNDSAIIFPSVDAIDEEQTMRMRSIATMLILMGMAMSQEAKPNTTNPNTAELAASSGVTPCIGAGADAASLRECEKRDTARLFLIAGNSEAALRILCNTRTAIEVFPAQWRMRTILPGTKGACRPWDSNPRESESILDSVKTEVF